MFLKLRNYILFIYLINLMTLSSAFSNPLNDRTHQILINKREGKSRHLTLWNRFWLKKKSTEINHDFIKDMSPSEQVCEENYLKNLIKFNDVKRKNYKYAFLKLRKLNQIDDISYQKILEFKKAPQEIDLKINKEKLKMIKGIDSKKIDQSINQFSSYKKKKKCLGESFKTLFGAITKSKKKKKEKYFKKVIKKLVKENVITKTSGKQLLALSKIKIHRQSQFLKDYIKTKNFVAKNIKEENLLDENKIGLSDLVSQKDRINKSYPRQRLYENYNQFQIIYMAQILERFLFRLENTALLGIDLIDRNDNTFETFMIDSPMEIYRFLVKYMRYEMAKLKENHLFSNVSVTYSDLIAASFELYQIPPATLDELRKMEEIWNPQLTKTQKIVTWGKLFTQAGVIFIPPPYNYLASLSIWVIESFVQNSKEEATYGHSIFGEIQ